MKIEGVFITHPYKLLYPAAQINKHDVAEYYQKIAPFMLPHIKDHPITLKRYHKGIEEEGFFNKHAPDYFPDFIKRISIPLEKETENIRMVTIEKAKDLVYLAGQNTIELHMGLSKVPNILYPNQIILDFDPSDNDFEKVRKAAFVLKKILDHHNIPSFLKTSGSRGVHVHIPLKSTSPFNRVKPIAQSLAKTLHTACPDITTLEIRKNKRNNKVFIDYLRNDYAMTAIAPYSLRALPNAPVATPIDWDELKNGALGPRSYHLKNIFKRLAKKTDPWKNFYTSAIEVQQLNLVQ